MAFKSFLGSTNISKVFEKPGADWSAIERRKIIQWLFEEEQLRYLLQFCFFHLGSLATIEDAEDAWSEFCTRRLIGVIDSYDPTKGRRFWNYLLFCLERECKHSMRKMIKEESKKLPIDVRLHTDEGDFEFIILPPYEENPASRLELQEFLQKLCCRNKRTSRREIPCLCRFKTRKSKGRTGGRHVASSYSQVR